MPVADLLDHEGRSALRRDLEHLSRDAGAQLLRALGVKGDEAHLRSASDEFSGHSLALTLLGSYLTDAYNGDIRSRTSVGDILPRRTTGAHAQTEILPLAGEGPELSVLRMLGPFDPLGWGKAAALLKPLASWPCSFNHLIPTQ
jgi:hypothetical protein